LLNKRYGEGKFLRRKEVVMAGTIEWETGLERALERAKSENKPVLLDFFNPG
jgi:hypothetical protein